MSILEVIKEPNKILRKKSQKITEITPELRQLVLDMAQTMKKIDGIGLAAPQIGKNIRLIIISTEKGPLTLFNPVITWKSLRTEIEEEGCLSCINKTGQVKRSKIIYVKALNENNNELAFRAAGLFARVIQHEVDHLDGILITDKFTNKKRQSE